MECFHCGSRDLRFSRPQSPEDSRELFRFRVPVRCRSCNDRSYVNLFRAWRRGILAKAPRKQHRHEGNASWVRQKSIRTKGDLVLNR
jgi:hypothetical protein